MDVQTLVESVRRDPAMVEAITQIVMEFEQEGISPDMVSAIGQAINGVLNSPETYPIVRAQAIEQGLLDEDDLPVEFNPRYLIALLLALSEITQRLEQSPRFARGGLARAGRGGDTMLAHINSAEAEALRRMGGSGTINPATGIHEFKGGGFKKLFKRVAPIALSIFGAPWLAGVFNAGLLGSIGAGAITGGLGSAISGGNVLKGAMLGGLGSGLGYAFGGGSSGNSLLGDRIGGGISMPDSFGAWGETAAQGLSSTPSAAGSALSGGMEALGAAGSGMAAPGLSTAMENIGGLGGGITGSLPELADDFLPSIPQGVKDAASMANSAYKVGKVGLGLYNALKPQEMPEPPPAPLGMNTNMAFGLGGTRSRGVGQLARGFRNGGLARITNKGY